MRLPTALGKYVESELEKEGFYALAVFNVCT